MRPMRARAFLTMFGVHGDLQHLAGALDAPAAMPQRPAPSRRWRGSARGCGPIRRSPRRRWPARGRRRAARARGAGLPGLVSPSTGSLNGAPMPTRFFIAASTSRAPSAGRSSTTAALPPWPWASLTIRCSGVPCSTDCVTRQCRSFIERRSAFVPPSSDRARAQSPAAPRPAARPRCRHRRASTRLGLVHADPVGAAAYSSTARIRLASGPAATMAVRCAALAVEGQVRAPRRPGPRARRACARSRPAAAQTDELGARGVPWRRHSTRPKPTESAAPSRRRPPPRGSGRTRAPTISTPSVR